MSWRTKGQYLGLDAASQKWLRRFDRDWDKKTSGRSRTDAIDRAGLSASGAEVDLYRDQLPFSGPPAPALAASEAGFRAQLEANFLTVARTIRSFTVPRATKAGWSIHIVLKDGRRTRVHYIDFDSALHAYDELAEVSQWFSGS